MSTFNICPRCGLRPSQGFLPDDHCLNCDWRWTDGDPQDQDQASAPIIPIGSPAEVDEAELEATKQRHPASYEQPPTSSS